MSKRDIKVYGLRINPKEWLYGDLSMLPNKEAGIWLNLLRLASISRDAGVITLTDEGQPIVVYDGLVAFDNVMTKEDFDEALKKYIELNMVTIDGKLLRINNWEKYEL